MDHKPGSYWLNQMKQCLIEPDRYKYKKYRLFCFVALKADVMPQPLPVVSLLRVIGRFSGVRAHVVCSSVLIHLSILPIIRLSNFNSFFPSTFYVVFFKLTCYCCIGKITLIFLHFIFLSRYFLFMAPTTFVASFCCI